MKKTEQEIYIESIKFPILKQKLLCWVGYVTQKEKLISCLKNLRKEIVRPRPRFIDNLESFIKSFPNE